jgi:hypothetical protein
MCSRSFSYLSGSYGYGIPKEEICDTFAIGAHCSSKDRDTRRDRVSKSSRQLTGQLRSSTLVSAVCRALQPDLQQRCGTWALSDQGRAVQALTDAIGQTMQQWLFLRGLP